MISNVQNEDAYEYWEVFRKRVFKLIYQGYSRLNPADHLNSEETDITGELVKEIINYIEDPISPRWVDHFSVHDDPPVNDPKRFGKRRKRIDIQFECVNRRPRPKYYFEAKRIESKNHGTIKYIGNDGLMEYVNGNYASDMHEAGMLGYIQSGNKDKWCQLLEKACNQSKFLCLAKNGSWTERLTIRDLSHTFCTVHHRKKSNDIITIYHILLCFYLNSQ